MYSLVEKFPNQLAEAIAIGSKYKFHSQARTINNVLITGLGGSGIGGTIIQNFTADKAKVPLTVNKDYFIPKFVGKETLTIACSYSGGTEETLMAMKAAHKQGSLVVCITSGGEMESWAKAQKRDCIIIPAGMPPRSCLGYSMVQLLYILAHYKIINKGFEKELKTSVDFLLKNQQSIKKEAQKLAEKILGKTPVIYAETQWEGVAVRFRQQINENAKMLGWHHVIPEMNHNELVGWRDDADNKVVLFLRNSREYERNTKRISINQTIIKKYCKNIINLKAKGSNYWEEVFYMIHITDFVSVALAKMRQMDDMEVKVIDYMKNSLAK